VARRILTIEEDARDAVQDAFISAFRSLDRFEGQARLSTWLHRIVVNTALMKLRRRKRKPEEPLEPLLPAYKDDGHQAIEPVEWSEPVDVALERDEVRAYVRAQVDRLPENYRTVLLLRDIEELTTPEAAAALGISENAVKIRLHRARQALRTLIDQRFRPASNGAAGDAERTLP
jgi:RNA polymerase sigma-70 factor (ECF subfamily)